MDHADPISPDRALIPPQTRALTPADRLEGQGVTFEIHEYDQLSGGTQASVARDLYYVHKSGMRLRQPRILLDQGAIRTEAGALYFMKGLIEMENPSGGLGGYLRKRANAVLSGEATFHPRYVGTGEIHLEPTFGHFALIELTGEEVIVDKGLFYACEDGVEVGVAMQKNISSALMGGEGLFQTRLRGHGICLLAIPVPVSEIIRYELKNERLAVDGSFALLRKGDINFTVERSAKGLLGSMTSGEGLLQIFSGTGEVWVAPTQPVYERIGEVSGGLFGRGRGGLSTQGKKKGGGLSNLLRILGEG